MIQARWKKHTLEFKRPSGTSRGVLKKKDSYFILLEDKNRPGVTAVGECGLLRGLSIDNYDEYENKLQEVCDDINNYRLWRDEKLMDFPSIRFGLEMAIIDRKTGSMLELFPSDFLSYESPIPINGLVWMGDKAFMFEQIKDKLEQGFTCVKMKIGAIDFEAELELLRYIREQFSEKEIELRVDANGAFSPENALEKLKRLSEFDLHSIEQPIRQGQWNAMAELCQTSPLDIALDEELIGIHKEEDKRRLLETIRPQYIILKPSLLGGFSASQEWIDLSREQGIGWWVTSALESNVGLNAIAQWTYTLKNPMHQGLGTGQLYTNNFESPLEVEGGFLYHRKGRDWDLMSIDA